MMDGLTWRSTKLLIILGGGWEGRGGEGRRHVAYFSDPSRGLFVGSSVTS